MRILGVDYGEARTGLAVSDALGWTAQALETLCERDQTLAAQKVALAAREQGAEQIVVGLPKNMDGSIGFRGQATQRFIEQLKAVTDLPVILWDERLTTVSAAKLLDESNVRGKKRKQIIDTAAATYILQSFLDAQNRK